MSDDRTPRLRTIEWMMWRRNRPSQRWSLTHLTYDDRKTLCGLSVPDAFMYDHNGIGDMCKHGERKLKEIEDEAAAGA